MTYGYLFIHSGSRKKKAKGKAKKANWYERLKVDELKEICNAAKIHSKGTKKRLIEQLMQNERTRDYGYEGKWVGTTVQALKHQCAERGLVQSGTKFALVKKLLQHDYGDKDTTKSSESSAAGSKRPSEISQKADTTGKKKSKPAEHNLEYIHKRVLKKILACKTHKKYMSDKGKDSHAPDLYKLIEEILEQELTGKGADNPLLALNIAKTALVCLLENFSEIKNPGCDDDCHDDIADNLRPIVERAKPKMDQALKDETIDWIEKLDSKLKEVGLGYSYDKKRVYMRAVDILRDSKVSGNPVASSSANIATTDDAKMPQKVNGDSALNNAKVDGGAENVNLQGGTVAVTKKGQADENSNDSKCALTDLTNDASIAKEIMLPGQENTNPQEANVN